jgi:HK97 family phage major capsid protein
MTTQELKDRRTKALGEVDAIIDGARKAQRGLTKDEADKVEKLRTESRTIYDELDRLEHKGENTLERLHRSVAEQGHGGDARGREKPYDFVLGRGIQVEQEERKQIVNRLIFAVAAARGDKARAYEYCKRMFGERYPLTLAIQRDMHEPGFVFPRSARTDENSTPEERALAAGDGPAGGFAVADEWSQDIIEFLRPASVVTKMGGPVLPMTTGTLRLPRISGGAIATYIGENVAAVKTQQTFGQVVANYKKLTALVPISNDLIRYASPSAETMIRGDLVSAMAQRADLAFIRDNGTASTPKGIRYWAPGSGVISAQVGQALSTTIQDLGKLVVQLRTNNVRFLNPGWLFAPRIWNYLLTVTNTNGFYVFRDEMLSKGTLWGYPFQITTQIPVNLSDVSAGTAGSEVYLADFADVVICQATQLLIDSSTEAAYVDGSTVTAAFALDQMVIRAILEHDLVARHDFSIAVLTGMTWA